jgi:hypothetical protein
MHLVSRPAHGRLALGCGWWLCIADMNTVHDRQNHDSLDVAKCLAGELPAALFYLNAQLAQIATKSIVVLSARSRCRDAVT